MINQDFYILKCLEKDEKILELEKRIDDLERNNNAMGMLLHVKAEIKRNNRTYVAEHGLIDGYCNLYERNIALNQSSNK